MPQGEQQPRWIFPTVNANASRKGPRTSTPPGFASKIVGIDGNDEGGLRPAGGFTKITDLNCGYGDDTALSADGGLGTGGDMPGIFGVTLRIGDTKYAYGFVYQVISSDGTKAAYHVKLRIGSSTTWMTTPDFGLTTGLITPEAYSGQQFWVEVVGRFVYVFRAGLRPFFFYIDEDPTDTYNLNVVTETGPGIPPTLDNPLLNGADTPGESGADLSNILTTMTAPSSGDADARILYFGFSGVYQVSSDGINYVTNPYLKVRNTGFGAPYNNLAGPSDIGLWSSPPQPDPSFKTALFYNAGTPLSPTYPAPPSAHTELEGLAYDKTARQDKEPTGLVVDSDGFVWAYRLFDSRTGRYSALSNRLQGGPDYYGYASVLETITVDQDGKQQSITLLVTFPMFQVIYKPDRYDTLLLYRGRIQQGVTAEDTILSLDSMVTLSDYHIDTQPVDPTWKIAAYFPVSTDEELSQQPTFGGDDTYEEEMPHAGSALFYEGTMLLGKTDTVDNTVGGLGKVVWSSLNEISVELVSAASVYALQAPDEEILRFCRLGPNVVGLTRINNYLIRREVNYLKAQPMHFGFGVVNPKAACAMGSDCYFICDQGMFSLSADGSLQSLSIVQDIIKREWTGNLDNVEMAFDTACSAVFTLNPDLQRTFALWQTSQRMSEFYDTNFIHVFEADVPMNINDGSSRLQRRAVFAQLIETAASVYAWRLFTFDYLRSKGTTSTLEPTGKLIDTADTGGYVSGGGTLTVKGPAAIGVEGCYVYVLDGPYAGRRIRIRYRIDDTSFATDAAFIELTGGERLSISPIYFEWISTSLGLQDATGVIYAGVDFFSTRHVDGLACAFSNVSWSGDTDLPRYMGVIYRGTDDLPSALNYPTTSDRQSVASIQEGVSTYTVAFSDPTYSDTSEADAARSGIQGNALFPGVRIFITGLDFRMLAVRIDGSIRDDDAARFRSTS